MADDRTPTPRDRPSSEDRGDVSPVLLDISRLTPDERRTVTHQVETMATSLEAQCPVCRLYVVRPSLPAHLERCLPPVIRTRRLEVLARDGTVSAVVGDVGGEIGLALRDELGLDRLTIKHGRFGSAMAWHVGGTEVIALGLETAEGEDALPGIYFVLAGFDGVPALGWRVSDTGEVTPYSGDDGELSPDELERLIEETHAKFGPLLEKLRTDEENWARTTGSADDEPTEEELRAILRRTIDKFGPAGDEPSEADEA